MSADVLLGMIEAMLQGQFPSRPGDKYVLVPVPEGLLVVSREGYHLLVSVRRVELS